MFVSTGCDSSNSEKRNVKTDEITSKKEQSLPQPSERNISYSIGVDEGKPLGSNHAKKGNGLPSKLGFDLIANARYSDSGASNKEFYRKGIEAGFVDGFASISELPDRSKLRKLAWNNIQAGTELYDQNGKPVNTVKSSYKSEDLIVVQYPDGSIEQKKFSSMTQYWFTKIE